MSRNITMPLALFPIGYVQVGNQRLPVQIDDQWMLAFDAMLARVGGVSAPDIHEVLSMISQSMSRASSVRDGEEGGDSNRPGPPGAQGEPGTQGIMGPRGRDGEDGEDRIILIGA